MSRDLEVGVVRPILSRTCCRAYWVAGQKHSGRGCWAQWCGVVVVQWATARCSAGVVVVQWVRQRGGWVQAWVVPGRRGSFGGGFQKFSRPSWPKMCVWELFFGVSEQPWRFFHTKSFFGGQLSARETAHARSGAKWGRWVYERVEQNLGASQDGDPRST